MVQSPLKGGQKEALRNGMTMPSICTVILLLHSHLFSYALPFKILMYCKLKHFIHWNFLSTGADLKPPKTGIDEDGLPVAVVIPSSSSVYLLGL